MHKILLIGILMFGLTGCSALKIITAPFKSTVSTVPQQVTKSNKQMRCKGEIDVKEDGSIYCSDGFYLSEAQYDQKDRKLSLREKIGQFIMKGTGWLVWLVIISVILTFTGFGWIVSVFWQGVFGLGRVLRQIIKGVQDAKTNKTDLITALNASTDESVKQWIAQFKLNNNIK